MIEITLRNYLIDEQIVGDDVYLEVPENPPDEFIVIQQTGLSRENCLLHSVMAFQSYSTTKQKSAELNEAVIQALIDCDEETIASCRLNRAYDYPDTRTKKYRYQAVFAITHYIE